jgi:hypothetical protein
MVSAPHTHRERPLGLFVTLHHHNPVHHNPRPRPPTQRERFWAAGHDSNQGNSAFSHTQLRRNLAEHSASALTSTPPQAGDNDLGDDSDGTEIAGGSSNNSPTGQPAPRRTMQQPAIERVDHARDERVLRADLVRVRLRGRKLGPSSKRYILGMAGVTEPQRTESGRWRLDECPRCACSYPPAAQWPNLIARASVFAGSRRSLLRAGLADVRGKAWARKWPARVGSRREGCGPEGWLPLNEKRKNQRSEERGAGPVAPRKHAWAYQH